MSFSLADCTCDIIDCLHATAPYSDSGEHIIRTTDIENGRLLLDNTKKVDSDTFEIWTQRGEPEPFDIILAREAPVGEVGVVPDNTKVCLGQRTVLIKPNKNKVHPLYLLYCLTHPKTKKQLLQRGTGSIVKHLNVADIRGFEVPLELLPLDEQEEIAVRLYDIDKLISINKSTIRELEEYMQLIYHKWFIDFNFPNSDGMPYKDSQGAMHEVDGMMIPVGWSKVKFNEIVSLKNGLNYSADKEQLPNSKIISVKQLINNFLLSEEIADDIFLDGEISSEYLIGKNDTIVARSASPGECALALDDLNVYYSGFSIRIRPNSELHRYIVFFNTLKLQNIITSSSDGTIIKNVTQQNLSKSILVLGKGTIVNKFNELVEPMFLKLKALNKENRMLVETRDLLVQSLIS